MKLNPSNNLPTSVSSFIGREREIRETQQLLLSNRLLTLTGPGGCGKTRLALKVAQELTEEFEHGVWLVELASLLHPALVPQTIASTLNIREQSGRSLMEILVKSLSAREREVAALIAQGKTNREIAEAMIVGVKTIETYVTRILNKLGFDSRVHIATWAVEKRLAPLEKGQP